MTDQKLDKLNILRNLLINIGGLRMSDGSIVKTSLDYILRNDKEFDKEFTELRNKYYNKYKEEFDKA